MIDSRRELRGVRARWLRVRTNVRALAAKLAAAEHAVQRDARRSDDPQMRTLVEGLAAERRAIDILGAELDARIRTVEDALRAIETASVAGAALAARAARTSSPSVRSA